MSKIKIRILLTIILVIGLLLRLYHNTDISLWHDEAFSALLIKYPWGEMFYRIGLDVHPPAYYVALRLWDYAFGDSLLALRGFSIFFGLLTAVGAYAFVKAAFKSDPPSPSRGSSDTLLLNAETKMDVKSEPGLWRASRAALIAALLIAISPFQIQYATEARMYTFGAFFAVLSAYFLIRALDLRGRANQAPKEWTWWILFGLACGIAALTHYYLLFTVAALFFYALAHTVYYHRLHFRAYLPLLISYIITLLVFVPWLKWFLYQFKQVGAGYWIPPMDRWSIPTTIWQMLLGIGIDINNRPTQVLVVFTTLFTLFFLYRFINPHPTLSTLAGMEMNPIPLRRTQKERDRWANPHKWLVLLALVAPFGGSILFLLLAQLKGENSSVYLVRYFLYSSTFYLVALAVWLNNIKTKWLLGLLLTAYCLLNLGAFIHYWKDLDVKTKPGMAGAVQYLKSNTYVTDKLYVGSSFEFFNLKYYANKNNNTSADTRSIRWSGVPNPKLYSGGNTSVHNLPHFAGTAILTDADLLPNFNQEVAQGDTVWLLWTNGFGGSKPETPKNWKQVDEVGFADVRPYVGTWIVVTKYMVE